MFICDISIFNRFAKNKLDFKLARLELNWRDLVVLLIIDRASGIAQTRLTPFLQTDKANVTKLLKALEKKDLICRIADPKDQRNKVCFLTTTAQALVPELYEIINRWENDCFRGLTEEERAEFHRLSEKVTANLLESRYDEENQM